MAYHSVKDSSKYEYIARSANGRRHRKRRKQKQSFFNTLFLIVLCIVLVLLVCATLFRVEEILIEGESRYDPSKIKAASGIMYGDNIYSIDKNMVIRNIEKEFNYIEDVEIKTSLFGTVVIAVKETRPSYAIENGSTYILLSSGLKIIEMDVDILPANIPTIVGVNALIPTINTKLRFSEENFEKEEILLNIIRYIEECGFKGINKIDITETLNIQMEYENRIVILIGTKNKIKSKVENAKYIIDTQAQDKNYYCIETIFQESDVPRCSIRPIASLEAYYDGHESIVYVEDKGTQDKPLGNDENSDEGSEDGESLGSSEVLE